MCDLLWSDPSSDVNCWSDNVERGISFYFGPKVVNNFLHKYESNLRQIFKQQKIMLVQ